MRLEQGSDEEEKRNEWNTKQITYIIYLLCMCVSVFGLLPVCLGPVLAYMYCQLATIPETQQQMKSEK